MAITLLIATTGVTLNKHYCMGRLKSVTVNVHTPNCAGSDTEDSMPCCKNTSEELKVEEITTVSFAFEASPDLYELATLAYMMLPDFQGSTEVDLTDFQHYSPPLPDWDIPVLNQSFLI